VNKPMPRPRKPYLHRETDKGKTYWYFRRSLKDKRIRIRGEYDTPEFNAAYDAAMAGQPVEVSRAVHHASLRWLADRWKESADWSQTAASTRTQRDNILDRILAANGDLSYAGIGEAHIQDGMERRHKTPFAANNYLKTMRALFRWARTAKHVTVDPTAGIKLFSRRTKGHEPWTDSDLASYRARWPVGTRQRLAMELIYWTGLRRGDAVRLGRPHIGKDGIARITAEKTGHRVSVPIPAPLKEVLDAGPVGELTFIAGEKGKPLTKESFGTYFRIWCEAAEVKASAHGLRKLAASEAAEAGAADQQLDAMFGWQSPNQSRVYTRAARQDVLAKEAQEKRVKNVLFPSFQGGSETAKQTPKKSRS